MPITENQAALFLLTDEVTLQTWLDINDTYSTGLSLSGPERQYRVMVKSSGSDVRGTCVYVSALPQFVHV